jgi:hypothetical protein
MKSKTKQIQFGLTLLLITIALLVLGMQRIYADLTYNIVDYPTHQNGHSLTGSIITLDSATDDGILTNSEIVDWSFSVQGPVSLGASKADNPSLTPFDGIVNISPTEITLAFPDPVTVVNEIRFNSSTGVNVLEYIRVNDFEGAGVFSIYRAELDQPGNITAWDDFGINSLGGNDPWIVASIEIPEPITSTLALTALLVTFGRRRTH